MTSDELYLERQALLRGVRRLYRWPRSVVLIHEQRERRAKKLLDRAYELEDREWELRKREHMTRILDELATPPKETHE